MARKPRPNASTISRVLRELRTDKALAKKLGVKVPKSATASRVTSAVRGAREARNRQKQRNRMG